MTFEVGKEYPTRSGSKAKVQQEVDGRHPLLVRHEDGNEILHYHDGSVYSHTFCHYDLIAPAIEPDAPAPAAEAPAPFFPGTLRDWFAGQWVAAGHHSNLLEREAAEQAYAIADAMLAARAKGGAA